MQNPYCEDFNEQALCGASTNIRQVFESIVAVGSRRYPAAVWGSPEAYYVPHLLVDGIPLSAVGAES
jgi:hypothetical protein